MQRDGASRDTITSQPVRASAGMTRPATSSREGADGVSLRTMNATEETITAAPPSTKAVSSSDRTNHPRNTAITGFTYAYVATLETGACCKSHTYAVNAN